MIAIGGTIGVGLFLGSATAIQKAGPGLVVSYGRCLGVSAGETENPDQVLPHAINSVIYWMLALYMGALLIIMSLVAWNQLSPDTSPFVLVFEKIGIPAGAEIIKVGVLTASEPRIERAFEWPSIHEAGMNF
jgi:L-asparagine transporter-like permease